MDDENDQVDVKIGNSSGQEMEENDFLLVLNQELLGIDPPADFKEDAFFNVKVLLKDAFSSTAYALPI